MNVLRSLNFPVAFYSKIASFSDFERIQVFFVKSHLFFLRRKADFWMFCEILLIHSHSSENLLPVGILKNSFFSKTCFLNKSPNFPLFWEILPIHSHPTTNLLHWAIFSKKIMSFFENQLLFLSKTLNFELFENFC